MKKFILFLILILAVTIIFAQNQADSLLQVLQKTNEDSTKIITLIRYSELIYLEKPESADSALNMAAELINNYKELIKPEWFYWISMIYFNLGDYEKRTEYLLLAIEEADNQNLITQKIEYINWLGYSYSLSGEFEKSITILLENLEYINSHNLEEFLERTYLILGFAYRNYQDYESALDYFTKSYNVADTSDINSDAHTAINEIGNIYNMQGNYEKSLEYHLRSLKIREKIGFKGYLSYSYNDIANDYILLEDYDLAIEYLLKACELSKQINDVDVTSVIYSNLATCYLNKKDYANAKNYLDSAEILGEQSNILPNLEFIYKSISEYYRLMNDCQKAFEYSDLYISIRDSIRNEETKIQVSRLESKYKLIEKEKEIIIANAKLKRKNILIIVFIIGAILVVLFALSIYRQYRQKKEAYKSLEIKNQEILLQKEEILSQRDEIEAQRDEITIQKDVAVAQKEQIEKQNQHITESINYARRIQDAVLPDNNEIKSVFPNSFVYYKPKDIVSGDFYWVKQINGMKIIAVADCTGHGVPGAFMSMLGISLLNEIVRRAEISEPNLMLEEIRNNIKKSLKQTGRDSDSKDGMDIALCIIDSGLILKYSGANLPAIVFKNNEMIEFKPERQPIGIYPNEKPFTVHSIQLAANDNLFLFSDGYIDQFGGKNNEKFKFRRFKNLLISLRQNNIEEQYKAIDSELNRWTNYFLLYKQLDDILIIGINF